MSADKLAARVASKSYQEYLSEINAHDKGKSFKQVYEESIIYLFCVRPEDLTDDNYKEIVSELSSVDCGDIGKFFKEPPADLNKMLAAFERRETTTIIPKPKHN